MPVAQALHARMQPLLLFFVDGGSAIDVEDPCWTLLLALRAQGDHTVVVRTLVGVSCCCNFSTSAGPWWWPCVQGKHSVVMHAWAVFLPADKVCKP